MRYRDIYSPTFGKDFSRVSEYIIKGSAEDDLVMIEFGDEDIDKIRQNFDFSKSEFLTFAGEDGFAYKLTPDSFERTEEKCDFKLEKSFKRYRKILRRLHNAWAEISDSLNSYDKSQIQRTAPDIFAFKSFKWVDKENGVIFPFRMKLSKSKEKQPLVIFLHGAGAMGSDNIKQLFDGLPVIAKLKNRDCSVLFPQAPYGSNSFSAGGVTFLYLNGLKSLIEKLIEEHNNIDRDRIYLVGTSFGGGCVWQLIWDYPEFFACGVPVMGLLVGSKTSQADLSRIKDVPLWIAHSADDTNVPIDCDDYCTDELRKLGADIKYTRWEKYGHKMSGKFYKNEKWDEWLFDQRLK